MSVATDMREMVREQIEYRELLVQITKRDLLLRYKQTIMGFGWAVFMPLLNTAIFSVIFTRVAPLDTGVPYPVYAYCGLWAWNFFASSVKFAVSSLTGNIPLVTKVYFPREVLPVSAMAVSFVDFLVASAVLMALMAWYAIVPGPALLFLPVVFLVQAIFTTAIGLLLSMANLFYRDVKYLLEVVLQIWMFATSVVYPVSLIGGRVGKVLQLNPLTPIIEAYRSVILRDQLPPLVPFGLAALTSVVLLLLAWHLFHRSEYAFAETV